MAGEGKPAGGKAGLRLHHLRPAPGAHKARTRVGRGEASKGKTAGRGTKGTKARTQVPASFEGGQMPLHRRVPQLPGFTNLRFKTTYQVVNTGRLAAAVPRGRRRHPGKPGRQGRGALRRAGQDPRHGRRDRRAPGDRACLFRLRPGEDHRGGGNRYHAVTACRDERAVAPAQAGSPG